MKEQTQYSVTRSLVRERRTRKGQRGFAMEWIIIVLLVAAAVVGLVMVFSGSLRNMLGTATDVMTAKDVSSVKGVAETYETQRDTKLRKDNETAQKAGDKLGGNFGTKAAGEAAESAGSGGGEGKKD